MKKPNKILNGIFLKPLEIEVLKLVIQGYTNKEIAKELGHGVKYIDKILGHEDPNHALYKKIGVENKVQAGIWYAQAIKDEQNNRLNSVEVAYDDSKLNWNILYRAERDLARIFEVSSQGSRKTAIKWTREFVEDFTKETNKFANIKYTNSHWLFYRYLSEALYIWGCTSASIYTGVKPFNLKMYIANELDQIGRLTTQQMPYIWAHAIRGSAYYVENNYRAAFNEMSSAIKKGGLPAIWQSDVLRTKLISAAYMGMVDEVKQARLDIERLWYGANAPASEHTHHFMARDGIAKAAAILGSQDTWNLQEQAKTLINPDLGISVQPLMVIGTTLDAMIHLKQPDKDHAEELVINARALAGQNSRHLEQVISKSEKVLSLCQPHIPRSHYSGFSNH